jgi:hypothetical protein
MACDDDVSPAAERRNIFAELGKGGGVCPGDDLRWHARTRQCAELFDLGPIGCMRLERCHTRIGGSGLVSM